MARAGMLGKILASGSAVAFTSQAATAHRQNQFSYSDPLDVGVASWPFSSNVSAVTSGYIPHPGGGSFAGGVSFGDNSSQRSAYKQVSTTVDGTRHIFSCYVLMGDSSAPSVGLTNTTGDFSVVARGGICPNAATVTSVGSSVYRISVHYDSASGDSSPTVWGLIKYTGQSAKTFKASGFQLEKVPSVSSTVGTYTPTGATAEYGKYRLSSTYRVMDATATVTVLEEGNGAKYTAAGSGAASGTVHDIAVHPTGNWIATVGASLLKAHAWSLASGFGSPCSSIPTLPAATVGLCLAWSPAGDYLLVGHDGTKKFTVYPFNATTGTFSAALSSPATTPDTVGAGAVYGCAWHPSDGSFALAFDATPGCYFYNLSGGVIGAAASPVGGTPGNAYTVAWNIAGTRLIVGHAGTAANQTYLSMWAWASATSGALQSEPAAPPANPVVSLSVHPAGGHVAYVDSTAASVKGYVLTSGTSWGAAITALAMSSTCNDVKFSPSGNHVAVADTGGDKLKVVPFAGAFAPVLAGPSTAAPGGTAIGWSPDGKTVHIGGGSSEYHHAYQFSKATTETWTTNRLDGWIQAAAANYARQGMLVSSSYLPMTVFSEARAFTLKSSADALDSTAFQSTWKSFKQGLNQASGSLEAFRTTDATLVTALTAKTPLVLEFWDNTTDSSEPIARVRALAKGHGTDTSVADLVKEGFEFEAMADSDNRVIAFPFLAL